MRRQKCISTKRIKNTQMEKARESHTFKGTVTMKHKLIFPYQSLLSCKRIKLYNDKENRAPNKQEAK